MAAYERNDARPLLWVHTEPPDYRTASGIAHQHIRGLLDVLDVEQTISFEAPVAAYDPIAQHLGVEGLMATLHAERVGPHDWKLGGLLPRRRPGARRDVWNPMIMDAAEVSLTLGQPLRVNALRREVYVPEGTSLSEAERKYFGISCKAPATLRSFGEACLLLKQRAPELQEFWKFDEDVSPQTATQR